MKIISGPMRNPDRRMGFDLIVEIEDGTTCNCFISHEAISDHLRIQPSSDAAINESIAAISQKWVSTFEPIVRRKLRQINPENGQIEIVIRTEDFYIRN